MDEIKFKSNDIPMANITKPITTNVSPSLGDLTNKESEDIPLSGVIINTCDIDISTYLPEAVFRACNYIIMAEPFKDLSLWPKTGKFSDNEEIRPVPQPVKFLEGEDEFNQYLIDTSECDIDETMNVLWWTKEFANIVSLCNQYGCDTNDMIYLQCCLLDLGINDYCVFVDGHFDLRKPEHCQRVIDDYGEGYLQGPMKRILNEFVKGKKYLLNFEAKREKAREKMEKKEAAKEAKKLAKENAKEVKVGTEKRKSK